MSILEFIIFLITGSIVLPNIYNQINDIINYQPQSEFDPGDLTNDICLGGICQNKCDNLNGQEVKRTGNTALLNQNNTFQAVDCGDDKVLRDLRYGGILCGEEGTDECNSGHCCYPKLCENDLDPLDDDDDYNRHYPTPEAKIEKKRRDGNCPYQKTVKKDTPCSGGNPGERGGCTDEGDSCCVPKTCANNWVSDQNPEWGSETTCPHQPDNVDDRGNSMIKYPDDTPCDTCDITECCYEQSDFCIVVAPPEALAHRNGDYNHANTNVQNVAFPSGTSLSFPGNDNTSVDLTTNYFLSKTDIENNTDNIKDILSFGVVGGNINSGNNFGIKCEDGFKYGMCSSTDGSIDDDACKTHDNNQRECEAAGCSFTLGDRPRVEYDECGSAAHHNIIKVSSCINTCTADYTLSDNGINYFTQTPISEGANIGSYRVNPDFYSNKLNTDNDYPYSQGEIQMDCYNHTGTGNSLHYNYTCEGGGSYFGVSELRNCNTTCSQLHDEGLRCGQGNIYDSEKADNISSYANFRETSDNGCCMPVTCDTLSNGEPVSCLPHQTRRTDTQTQDSEVSRDSCCVNRTCTDFMNEYNSLSGEEAKDNTNICLDGRNFNSNRELTSAYLYQVSDSDKLDKLNEYRSGSADYDIGCCSNLTCGEWLSNLDMPGISDDQKLSEASRMCGSGKFFVSDMFAGNMGGTITEDSPCCVGESDSTCSPTQELVSTSLGFTIPGYTLPDDIQFTEKTFNMDTSSGGGEYSIDSDNISCSAGFTPSDEGIKYKCRINPSTGDGTYYLSGCNSETPDTGSVETSDKLCNLPSQLENSIQLNGFSFDADNNVVNFNHFLGNQDQFSCNESTERPIFTECSEDFTEMTISGCHYQDKPTTDGENFYSDRFFRYNEHIHGEDRESSGHPCENLYNEEATDNHQDPANPDNTISGPPTGYRQELNEIADEIYRKDPSLANNLEAALNKMKGNVSNFSCKCQGEGDNECPDHERQVRFKYIFANDEDYYNDDNDFITNQQAIDEPNNITYPLDEILKSGFKTVCEPGYYPYRGAKYDYCRPCDDLYKNNHPISAIAESFCDSGHMGDSDNVTNLLDIEHESGFMNSNYESNSGDISTLRAVREVGEGECRAVDGSVIQSISTRQDCVSPNVWSVTETNEDYSPYLGNLGEDVNSINFMTADNFTLGTRVCDLEPDGSTACAPKVKLYGDYSQPATESSQFEKAKKWWRTYFNNVFNIDGDDTDNSDILDISSAPSGSVSDESKPTLKSRIDDTQQDLNNIFSNIRRNEIRGQTYNAPGYSYDINDITDLKKEHYLYRNNLELSIPTDDGGSNEIPISTVCNNNTSDVDYIPSFDPDPERSNEGSCKECVNEMPANDERIQNGNAPLGSPGDYIIRNINNNDNAPICSYEANMYNESYNEGNIVGFKRKSDNLDHREMDVQGPCNEGFIYSPHAGVSLIEYNNQGETEISKEIPYVRCLPQNKLITKFCENINEEEICNKSFSTFISDDVKGRLSDELKDKLETEERQMIDNTHMYGFCGWVINNGVGECKNIYDTNNGYLRYKSRDSLFGAHPGEKYSNHNSLYQQQSVLDILSPHITNYTTSQNYDYSNFYNNSFSGYAYDLDLDPHGTPYTNHITHDEGGVIKAPSDDVFDISNYGVGKEDNTATGDDLTSLSVANTLKEGYDFSLIPWRSLPAGYLEHIQPGIESPFDSPLNRYPLQPTRINPPNHVLNDDMINRCHPILWDGPVDFFYENKSGSQPVSTISSSCYLRDGSVQTYDSNTEDHHIVPQDSGDYSIKSTPLYYNKGRNLQGGSLVNSSYSENDISNNILNPGDNRDGIIYAIPQSFYYSSSSPVESRLGPYDSGFPDAAIFPLMDRVRGCFNDSLIYPDDAPSDSSLGLDADNINNEREQCIFHYVDYEVDRNERYCVNACLNHKDCDLVRMTRNKPETGNLRCELIKWNKLPDNINVKSTRLHPGVPSNNITPVTSPMDTIKKYNLGGHLINADPDVYDQSTRQGVVNWYERIKGYSATEMNHTVTVGEDALTAGKYRTEYYTNTDNVWSDTDIRDWRINHLLGDGNTGEEIEIKGRPLWKASDNDNEIWVSMNKIRAPIPNGKITDILNHINNHEMDGKTIQPIDHYYVVDDSGYCSPDSQVYPDSNIEDYRELTIDDAKVECDSNPECAGFTVRNSDNKIILKRQITGTGVLGGYKCYRKDNWRESITSGQFSNINEESTYILNDSSTTYPRKYNEKTIIDNSGNYKQCPPGTYVDGSDGSYKCSQVLNECASCQDIRDYHENKGDFEGMDDDEEESFMLSYGCLRTTTSHPWTKTEPDKYSAGATGEKILDSTKSYQKQDDESAQFKNQHNLIAKTPDGNIIDAEKCICPGTKTVHRHSDNNLARCDA